MVGPISWLFDLRRTKGDHDHHRRWLIRHEKLEILGVLAFDTAKSMSRLVSLYKSLSQNEMTRLRKEVMRAQGISYLVSDDEAFLLTLACAERLEDLDRAASAVARLGQKCSDYGLVRFGQVYKDLKKGYLDMEKLNNYGCKEMEKCMDKMEKLTSLTGDLYGELDALTDLEASERRLSEWRKNNSNPDTNYDLFDQKLSNQRRIVRNLKEISLWNKSYDKIVALMARTVCVLYARICAIFGPYISLLPAPSSKHGEHQFSVPYKKFIHERFFSVPILQTSLSCPINSRPSSRIPLVRFLSRESNIFITEDVVEPRLGLRQQNQNNHHHLLKHNNKVFQAAPPSTVGGSGLANRYANVIMLAEKYLNAEALIGDQARESLYNMLPLSLKTYVRSKLRLAWRETEDEEYNGQALAQGWREALTEMLGWLVPTAQDTLTWQAEKNLEKQKFDVKPTILLMQTLHYADLEKTEAAVAEVLIGLSCIYWYENRRISCKDIY